MFWEWKCEWSYIEDVDRGLTLPRQIVSNKIISPVSFKNKKRRENSEKSEPRTRVVHFVTQLCISTETCLYTELPMTINESTHFQISVIPKR